jgi:hypothetical protein
MKTWSIELPSGKRFTIEADTKEAARKEATRCIESAFDEIKAAKIKLLRSWTVDLGSFHVEAADEREAYEEAKKQIEEGDVEVDTIFKDENEDEEPEE